MNIDLLSIIPSNKEDIRCRLDACLDYLVKVRSEELDLNPEDLKQALPQAAFCDELPEEQRLGGSALGGFNYSQYLVKLNEEAIFSGKASVEMITLHEFTHAMDVFFVNCFIPQADYLSWLKRYIAKKEMLRYQPWAPMNYEAETPEFVQQPHWSQHGQAKASRLMEEVIEEPGKYFELGPWEAANAPTSFLLNRILRDDLGSLHTVEEISQFFMFLYYRYLCCYHETHSSNQLNDEQNSAIERLKQRGGEKVIQFARKIQSIPATLTIGAGALFCRLNAHKDYFDLPEAFQLEYLCAPGEIRARRETSRLLHQALSNYLLTHSSSNELNQEIFTLKSSVELENLLREWRRLRDQVSPRVFAENPEIIRLENKIRKVAVASRTHKLTKRFYPNETVYEICREWNEKRVYPIPPSVMNKLNDLSESPIHVATGI